jgi:iron complex outermembrane receptor protein
VNGYESWGVRGKLEFEPTDRLNILAAAEYRNNDSDCCQQILVRSDNPNLTELFSPIEPRPFYREAVANEGVTSETSQQTYSVQADYALDFATVTSITAYQNYEFSNNFDFDAIDTTVPVFTGPSFAAFDRNGGEFGLGQFSQELRLSSNGNRSLDYVFGLFYSNTNIDRNFERRFAVCPGGDPANRGLAIGDPCPAPLFLSGSLQNAHFDGESYAAFGQLDYDILDNLTVIGGLRVQREIIAVEGVQTGEPMVQGDVPLFRPVTGRVSTSDTALSGKAGLQYRFSTDAQAYATYTHGYKGPGLDTEVNTDFLNQVPLEPETVDAYELGFKGNLADGLVSLAIAAFYADYENLQILANRSDPETGNFSFLPTNAGGSVTKGVEVEANFWLSDAFSVLTAVNYVDAEIDADGLGCPLQFQAASVTVPVGGEQPINTCFRQALSGGGLSGVLQNVRGARLPSTPEWRVLISPKYEHEFGDSIGFVNLDLSYQSDVTFAEGDPLADQDGYALVDASIGFRPVGTGLSARVFVRNAFDQHYYTNFGAAALLTTATLTPTNRMGFVPKGAFRHFGATIGYTF